jgi:Flp pilus assembly protein TadG
MRETNPMRKNKRKAAVTVELAIAAPILFLVVFGSIEFARANMIRNTMENAAYEGARRGVPPGATAANCEAAAQSMLDIIGVVNSTVTVTPGVIQPSTEEVTVTVSVPLATNSYILPRYVSATTLQASITLPRESD